MRFWEPSSWHSMRFRQQYPTASRKAWQNCWTCKHIGSYQNNGMATPLLVRLETKAPICTMGCTCIANILIRSLLMIPGMSLDIWLRTPLGCMVKRQAKGQLVKFKFVPTEKLVPTHYRVIAMPPLQPPAQDDSALV